MCRPTCTALQEWAAAEVPYTFDSDDGRYRTDDGHLVRDDAVRRALDAVIAAQALTMRDLTQQMILGTLSLAAWQASMMQSIKAVHLVAVAVAHGGWNQLDQSDFGWVGSQIKPQYQWLARFSVEVSTGKQPLDGTASARAQMYASAARSTHREAQRRIGAQRAAGEEKSNLGQADHCKLCIQEARKGWQPFGTLLAIGRRTCLSNCRCWFTYRAESAA